jgi:DNA-binding transcriptional LysR family regulator
VLAAVERARLRAAGQHARLRIGLWSAPSGGDFLLQIVRRFRQRHPTWLVELVGTGSLHQIEALRAGDVDLLVLWLPIAEPDLVVGPILTRQERMVALSAHHPLATRDVITLEDLADHAVVSFHGVPESSLHSLVPERTPTGRPIPRRAEVRDQAELTHLVALGDVVHATVASVPRYRSHPDIDYRPLQGLPLAESALVWRRGAESPALRAFVEVANELIPS